MPVKDFKFVSPGVFINEIDNSYLPKKPDSIGAVAIGRSSMGLAMQPIKVDSFTDFVSMYGDTVAGNAGGDISRFGNLQSPMYGTYAAKAYLNSEVAPLTYVRLLGQQNEAQSSGYEAGWHTPAGSGDTLAKPTTTATTNGGAWGLFLFPSGSATYNNLVGSNSGRLAAVFYMQEGANIYLTNSTIQGAYSLIPSVDKQLTAVISSSAGTEKITFDFDYQSEHFIRNKFNTNPQLIEKNQDYYPTDSKTKYWLGETFEQFLEEGNLISADVYGVIVALSTNDDATVGLHNMKGLGSQEARTGWFIGQDLGDASSFNPANMPKLFRLMGRGHGEWLHKNVKVTIDRIRESNSYTSDYGTFSVVVRSISDTDANPLILERFDNLSLNPNSPNFISKVIGDKYMEWNETEKTLVQYGEYDNKSKFFYVDANQDLEAGALDPKLLPFGCYMPPKISDAVSVSIPSTLANKMIFPVASVPSTILTSGQATGSSSGSIYGSEFTSSGGDYRNSVTCSFTFPSVSMRTTAEEDGLSDATEASFGFRTTKQASSVLFDASVGDMHRFFRTDWDSYVDSYSTIFTLNDVYSNSGVYTYEDGYRASNPATALSASQLLDAGYDSFTVPMYGGFDGFDITKPDPLANSLMTSTSNEKNNYVYNTYKRAIQIVSDPEFLNSNILVIPGLTNPSLTGELVKVAEKRADSLALIDLEYVYIPSHEAYAVSKAARIGTTPRNAANALKRRQIDSSYGATFYPWVQTVDPSTGQNVWIPPTVAVLGVLASSEKN